MNKILVIDDNEDMRGILSEILKRKGYEVVGAEDGEEGMLKFRENPVPLVITDIIMPKKDGVEVIRELERDFPEVSVIAISGGGTVKAIESLKIIEDMSCVKKQLKKPFTNSDLLQAVRDILG